MNYYQEMKVREEDVRKDLKTYEEVKKLPIFAKTPAGYYYKDGKRVDAEEVKNTKKPYYVFNVSNSVYFCFFFFEKAILKGMKGVKLHLWETPLSSAKTKYKVGVFQHVWNSADQMFEDEEYDKWLFITPDWRMYDMEGNPIKMRDIKSESRWNMDLSFPRPYSLELFAKYGWDLRATGEIPGFVSNSLLSPVTVELLKGIGFDMDTDMRGSWEIRTSYGTNIEGSYRTDIFLKNLSAPTRVAKRKEENKKIVYDYSYYKKLLGDNKTKVIEENGKIYAVARDSYSIIVIPLKTPGDKEKSIVYSDIGSKVLSDSVIPSFFCPEGRGYSYLPSDHQRDYSVELLNELLTHKEALGKTCSFRNIIGVLEEGREWWDSVQSYDAQKQFAEHLNYLMTPNGQKDLVFEETLKRSGFVYAVTATEFLSNLGIGYSVNPILSKTTPYEQAGMTKKVYYETLPYILARKKAYLNGLFEVLVPGYREFDMKQKREVLKSFCHCASPEFLSGLFKLKPNNSWFGEPEWEGLVFLSGSKTDASFCEKMAALARLFKKMPDMTGDNAREVRDYYGQLPRLRFLGVDWPTRYEDFHVKNLLRFMDIIYNRGFHSWAISISHQLEYTSFSRRISLLHELQNYILISRQEEEEKERIKALDDKYSSWKEKLKKDLSWENGKFKAIIPESLAELTAEGKVLSHCVGSYKESVANKREGIVFLRESSSPAIPYYTVDVVRKDNGDYFISECFGYGNRQPTPEVVDAMKQWAQATGKIDEASVKDHYGARAHL